MQLCCKLENLLLKSLKNGLLIGGTWKSIGYLLAKIQSFDKMLATCAISVLMNVKSFHISYIRGIL